MALNLVQGRENIFVDNDIFKGIYRKLLLQIVKHVGKVKVKLDLTG